MGERADETDQAGLTDEEQWIWESAKSYADTYVDSRNKFITHFIDSPSGDHAYDGQTLAQLRRLLDLDEAQFPDEVLHDHTDALVVLIGRALIVTKAETTKERLKRLRGKLLAPTEKFLAALQDEDLAREFLHDDLPLDEENREEVLGQVEAFKESVKAHMAQIKSRSRKGKSWDSEAKDRFVTYVDWLCEFLNPSLEPRRAVDAGSEDHSQFGKCVYLLAEPLKWGDKRGSEIKFDGAIRKHVDEWQVALRKTIQELEAERNG